eukprot:CAMPEP_0113586740 /NCGR_PEP_ID=MMETSP0015_2-20120614/34470_1 /TAXON_ID=2838 /ORGANISM="Odontella" /LENGTH=145 /DNA_ID=CAMNT_0000492221 /DNA_START=113 /DNA_END=550 /DNA_ORIENTATION=+ /assembly_acc=CAM_ASM_000160
MTEMNRLATYFSYYDGHHTWEDLRPIVEDLAHPDLSVITGKGTLNRHDFLGYVERLIGSGSTIDVVQMISVPPDGIHHTIDVYERDGGTVRRLVSVCRFRDGRMIRVEPSNPADYNVVYDMADKAEFSQRERLKFKDKKVMPFSW